MANRFWFFWGLTLTLVGTFACEKLAGIEKKQLIVENDAGVNSPACSALSTNGIGLRIANMIPTDDKLDVCIKPAGGQFPAMPLFASGGNDCPAGVGYGQYTVSLSASPGKYDVKLVTHGSDCSADGPTVDGVEVKDRPSTAKTSSTTVVAYGSDLTPANAKVVGLQDANSTGSNIYVRFFNALNGGGTLNAGLVNPNVTPPQITSVVFSAVVFGSVAAPSTQAGRLPVDELGYLIYSSSTSGVGGLNLGAGNVNSATPDAFINSFISLQTSHHYSLFLMGISGQKALPFAPKLWACDETTSYDNVFADCGDPNPISVGVFHPNLTDIFTDYIDERTGPALAAIAESKANILCLTELYPPEIRQGLKTLVTSSPGFYSDDYPTLSTSDLTDQKGNLPTYPDVACAGDFQTSLQQVEACLLDPALGQQGCIVPDDPALDPSLTKHHFAFKGSLAIGCAAQACQTPIGAFLLAGSHEAESCFMCAIAHLSSGEAIEDMYAKCTSSNQGKPHFVYDGSTGLAVLTSSSVTLAPGETPEVVALPASTWNRAAIRVPLKLPNNAIVDFWCSSVRAPNSESFLPNGGPYYGFDSSGQPNAAGVTNTAICNAAEENLQITRLIAAVNSRATDANRRAIVAALTYASPLIGNPDNPVITDLSPENFALFGNPPWEELTSRGYQPQCTFCGDNPLNGGTNDKQWSVHLFGIGIGADAVTDTRLTFTGNTVQVTPYDPPGSAAISVPVSQYYGLQSVVRVTQ